MDTWKKAPIPKSPISLISHSHKSKGLDDLSIGLVRLPSIFQDEGPSPPPVANLPATHSASAGINAKVDKSGISNAGVSSGADKNALPKQKLPLAERPLKRTRESNVAARKGPQAPLGYDMKGVAQQSGDVARQNNKNTSSTDGKPSWLPRERDNLEYEKSSGDPDRPLRVYLNKDNQRVDMPYPKPSQAALQRLDDWKQQGRRPCQRFLLLGYCPDGIHCEYDHCQISDEESLASATRARQSLCKSGSMC